MRTFEDRTGASWDVVAGRESWGVMVAIFVPRDRGGEGTGDERGIRQARLGAASYEEAVGELGNLDDEGLGKLLGESELRGS